MALDRAAAHRERTLVLGAELDAATDRLAIVRAGSSALTAVLASLAGVTLLALGIQLVGEGRLDGVYLAALPLVAIASFEVIGPLAQAFGLWDTNKAAAERLFELTDAPPAVVEGRATRTTTAAAPTAPVSLPHGRRPGPAGAPAIDIRGLRFRYGPDEPLAVDGLDLSVAPGGSLAIVGPSGSGKSTLVNLLLRFWEYERGQDPDRRARPARLRRRRSAGCWASCPRTSTCSTRPSATTSRSPTRT